MKNSFKIRLKYFLKNLNRNKKLQRELEITQGKLEEVNKENGILYSELFGLKNQVALEEQKKRQKHKEKVDPYIVDHYRVIYDKDSELTAVYFNDNQLHGCMDVGVNIDPDTQMTTLSLEVFGDIKVEQGEVKDFEKGI